ncbi:hypothetical protein DEU56DRAFT_757568 [Suillus clintonianus]|uniref:uncharacterized protein n=1 Tax=Suillus clintonianus TaxID=1904413 RepID=UPI001B86EF7B|nr:uncharacterized protein DEU56DRAFT_757568 [Suillus clintonianus]KAG2131688.1 hypothetical protein DEU56DRAFT_757568 [Suillus clintonianus]
MNEGSFQQQLLTEMHKMNACLAAIESASQIIIANQQTTEEHAHQHENTLNKLMQNIDAMMVSSNIMRHQIFDNTPFEHVCTLVGVWFRMLLGHVWFGGGCSYLEYGLDRLLGTDRVQADGLTTYR